MSEHLALIIEDNQDLATIIAHALQAAGFETSVVKDGQRVLAQLEVSVPNVVILDLHLANMSGEAILEEIATDERLGETHVIIATADPGLADRLKHHADEVLLKPITFRELRRLAASLAPQPV